MAKRYGPASGAGKRGAVAQTKASASRHIPAFRGRDGGVYLPGMVHRIGDKAPIIDPSAYIAWNAEVAGEVRLGASASVWFSATLRGDLAGITVGTGSNVQDGATLHVDTGLPLTIGERVTIGHNAVLHGCTVGSDCLIGMGAVVLSGAVIGPGEHCGRRRARDGRQILPAAVGDPGQPRQGGPQRG